MSGQAPAGPTIIVQDVRRSIEFYAYLGFEVRGRLEAEGVPTWAWLATDGADVMVMREGSAAAAGEDRNPGGGLESPSQQVFVKLFADDLDRLADQLRAAGVAVQSEPDARPAALRVPDPDGHLVLIAARD